jgi:hypothetical protein
LTSHLPFLLEQALVHVPRADQLTAVRVATLLQIGYGPREVAQQLELRWSDVEGLRECLRRTIIEALRSDGYSDREIVNYLRAPIAD